MENKKVKTKVIPRNNAELFDPSIPEQKVKNIERAADKVERYSKISDAVAQSSHWVRNEPIPFGDKLFPHDWKMRYSDLFYPVAKGGPLYFDTPTAPYDVTACEVKMKAYQEAGIRYTYVASGEGEIEAKQRLSHMLPVGKKEIPA